MILAGIFVGGASRRMGGAPKGLLPAPDTLEPLVVRLARIAAEASLTPCLVGRADAYRALVPALPVIDDDPAASGPLAGLRALVRQEGEQVIALSCDLALIACEDLVALRAFAAPPGAVAPRRAPSSPWEPLVARYDCAPTRVAIDAALAEGARSLQAVLRRLDVTELTLPARATLDWDHPEDISRRA